MFHIYRPQTKFAKVMFLHLPVSHSVHRGVCVCEVHAGIHPPPQPTRGRHMNPRPEADTLQSTHHPGGHTPQSTHSPRKQSPLRSACWEIRAKKRPVRILLEYILVVISCRQEFLKRQTMSLSAQCKRTFDGHTWKQLRHLKLEPIVVMSLKLL